MNLVTLIQQLKRTHSISKILIFNDFSITKYDLIKLNQLVDSVYVSFYNNFANRNLLGQLRTCQNIHVVEANSIPNLNYDFISSSELSNSIVWMISRIKYLKFFYCSDETELQVDIPGFIKDTNIQNLYKRNNLILVFDNISDSKKSFKADLSKINDEEKKNQILNKNLIQNIKKKPNLLVKNESNIILIKNIVSSLTKFSNFKEESKLKNGELDICCVLSSKKDHDLFLKLIDYMSKNYSYVKYFIFLNGKTILKYFKENNLSSLNYLLFKEKNPDDDIKVYSEIFELLANGSYKFYMNEINFNEEIINLL